MIQNGTSNSQIILRKIMYHFLIQNNSLNSQKKINKFIIIKLKSYMV